MAVFLLRAPSVCILPLEKDCRLHIPPQLLSDLSSGCSVETRKEGGHVIRQSDMEPWGFVLPGVMWSYGAMVYCWLLLGENPCKAEDRLALHSTMLLTVVVILFLSSPWLFLSLASVCFHMYFPLRLQELLRIWGIQLVLHTHEFCIHRFSQPHTENTQNNNYICTEHRFPPSLLFFKQYGKY